MLTCMAVCTICKTDHEEDDPHNPYNPEYREVFKNENRRYPTWDDAMADLPWQRQEKVRKILRKLYDK